MKYARMGRSGLLVSRLSFGATDHDVAALDGFCPPARPYPHWFIDLTADQAHTNALGATKE